MATSIQPIYLRHALDLGGHAAYLHEISDGRFRLGLGVTHHMVHNRLGVTVGKPLEDMREYVVGLRRVEKSAGPLPPIVLATLRDRMLDLSLEISEGAVWANAAFRHGPSHGPYSDAAPRWRFCRSEYDSHGH